MRVSIGVISGQDSEAFELLLRERASRAGLACLGQRRPGPFADVWPDGAGVGDEQRRGSVLRAGADLPHRPPAARRAREQRDGLPRDDLGDGAVNPAATLTEATPGVVSYLEPAPERRWPGRACGHHARTERISEGFDLIDVDSRAIRHRVG